MGHSTHGAWKDLLNSFGARCAAKAKVGTTSPKIFGCCVLSKTFHSRGMTGPADLIKGKNPRLSPELPRLQQILEESRGYRASQ